MPYIFAARAAIAALLPATPTHQPADRAVTAQTSCDIHPVHAAERHARRMFAGDSTIPKRAYGTQIRLIRCIATRAGRLRVKRYDHQLHIAHASRRAAALAPAFSYATASYYIDPAGSGNCCGFNAPQGVAVCGSGGGPCVPMGTRIEFTYAGRETVCVADDHGPYVAGRSFDLDQGCATALNFSGVQTVGYRIL